MPAADPVPTTQAKVLKAVRKRLLDTLSGVFTEKNCVISDSDSPMGGRDDYYTCHIWALGGEFDAPIYEGAGSADTREQAGVSLTVYRKNRADRTGESEDMLFDDSTGLFELKRRILREMLTDPRLQWEGDFILTEEMRPSRSDHPKIGASEGRGRVGDIYLEFQTPFAWDLT